MNSKVTAIFLLSVLILGFATNAVKAQEEPAEDDTQDTGDGGNAGSGIPGANGGATIIGNDNKVDMNKNGDS